MADNLDTPYSRREIFYKGILDQDPDSLPDPETREERYLKAIAEAYPTPVEATVTQDEGSSMTSVMSQKAVTDALDGLRDSKLDKTGTAPLADNLTPYSVDSGATQSVPFINQGTGCGNGESVVDTGSYCQLKKKLGNTVCVNQIVSETTKTEKMVTYSVVNGKIDLNGTASSSATIGFCSIAGGAGRKILVRSENAAHEHIRYFFRDLTNSTNLKQVGYGSNIGTFILTIPATCNSFSAYMIIDSGTQLEHFQFTLKIIDLSLWYGSTSAIPAHLLSHPENWGRYYSGSLAYNPGQLVNADGSVLTSVGRNCWDGENDVTAIPNQAYYCKGTATITYKDRGGNTISTASVTDTSFTTPADCFSFGVSGTGVTISLYYSGESGYDSDYPFSVLAEVDTGSEVLRSAGAIADEKTPDGTITRRVGVVDMGDLSFTHIESSGRHIFETIISDLKPSANADVPINAQSPLYISVTTNATWVNGDVSYSLSTGSNKVTFINNSYSDVASFTAAMSGVPFYYELATPTTEQGTPFSGASADNFAIDDFGSMYWTQTNGVPQGVEIFYPFDYKAAVDTLLNMVEGDVEELVTETELDEVAGRIPEAPAEDGTYTLKATVVDGVKTYAWVADE